MENKPTNMESLMIIEQMINRAKDEEKDSGLGWIIWGWILIVASLVQYTMILTGIRGSGYVWVVFGFLGLALMAITFYRKRKKPGSVRVRTYTGELVDKIGDAFFISLIVSVIGAATTGQFNTGVNFGYLLLLYAVWLYVHGAAFRFNAMKNGAYVNWLGAIVIFIWYKELGRNILLVHALCVFLGYIIPGYMARRKFSEKTNTM